jgi:hypothetical protein
VPSQGRFGRVLSSEAAVPSSSIRVVASCPSRIHAQLRNPGDPGDGYHDTATDGGDQQRHSQREGAREAQVVNLYPRRVLQNEDDEHRQEQECGSRGHPSGANASYSWRTLCGGRAGSGRRWCLLRCLGSRRGRVSRHDICVPSKSRSALSGPMTCRRPLAAWGLTRPGACPIPSCARRARRATAEGCRPSKPVGFAHPAPTPDAGHVIASVRTATTTSLPIARRPVRPRRRCRTGRPGRSGRRCVVGIGSAGATVRCPGRGRRRRRR